MSSIHPDISDRLLSYLEGRLDEESRRQVQVHLEACGSCAEELAAIRAIAGAIRRAGQDSLAANAAVDRYGCPGAEELTSYELQEAAHPTEASDWIGRHLKGCSRCQHEVDLIRLIRLELSEPSVAVAPQDLSARVEERLMARVRQGERAGLRIPFMPRLTSLRGPILARVALGVALAAAVAVWGLIQFQRGPVLVAQRSSEQEARGTRPPPPPVVTPQRQPEEAREPKIRLTPTPTEAPSPRASSPSVVARVEPPAPPSSPSVWQPELALPSAAERERRAPATPLIQPSLPPLVPAKQGEALKVLILPIPNRPGLRSAVAAGLEAQLGTVQPPDREFPPGPSVDDLTANRRLGRLFGVRYVLEIDVKEKPLGYLVVLRAADTETGGVVAKREELVSEEGALAAAASRLAKQLQQELKGRP